MHFDSPNLKFGHDMGGKMKLFSQYIEAGNKAKRLFGFLSKSIEYKQLWGDLTAWLDSI